MLFSAIRYVYAVQVVLIIEWYLPLPSLECMCIYMQLICHFQYIPGNHNWYIYICISFYMKNYAYHFSFTYIILEKQNFDFLLFLHYMSFYGICMLMIFLNLIFAENEMFPNMKYEIMIWNYTSYETIHLSHSAILVMVMELIAKKSTSIITWCLESPTTWLFVQQIAQTYNKYIQALHYWPFTRGTHWWISNTKGQ